MVDRATLGVFWLVKGVFELLIFGMFCLWFVLMGGIAVASGEEDGVVIGGVFIGMSAFVFVTVSLFTLPNFILAYGLIRQRSWGDLAGILLAALNMFHFPVGSILSVVTFMVVMKKK